MGRRLGSGNGPNRGTLTGNAIRVEVNLAGCAHVLAGEVAAGPLKSGQGAPARTEVPASKLVKGFGRVGHRRVTLSHVSCTPSSNRTCGFPASGSPTIFSRRHAPQARQMAHPSHHLVQPTPFIQEPIVPALPSGPPTALMLASEP